MHTTIAQLHSAITPTRVVLLAALLCVATFATMLLSAHPAHAVNVITDGGGTYYDKATDENIENNGAIADVVNILVFIIGVIAVIAIIIGGIRYATSNGDASQTKSAKNTIMYAVIGLVAAIMAWGIVSFVLNAF